jgi:hypothetical protein
MTFNNEKPWSVAQFEQYRPELTSFIRQEIAPVIYEHRNNKILIRAPVKSGKREMVEYIAIRDIYDEYKTHVFISAFHRKSDKCQRTELENYDIHVFSIYDKKRINEAIRFISDNLVRSSQIIIIHWDECDYGTGEHQSLSEIYNPFRDHPNIIHIRYSATPEELEYSTEYSSTDTDNFVTDFFETGIVTQFIPPAGYCGGDKFLDEGLVTDASPFFDVSSTGICLTEQGKEIVNNVKKHVKKYIRDIHKLRTDLFEAEDEDIIDANKITEISEKINNFKCKNIICLRICYKNGDDDDDDDNDDTCATQSCKAIYTFLKHAHNVPELTNTDIYVDKHDVGANKNLTGLHGVTIRQIEWSDKTFWDRMPSDKPTFIVHDQTSTRSTEWKFHDRIFAVHDYRKRITFNAYVQAILRSSHYMQNYNGFQRIQIYGHKKTLLFLANRISIDEYMNNDWISRKVPKSDPPRYRIKNTVDACTELPLSLGGGIPNPDGYNFEDVQRMITQLGCTNNGGTKLSQRISGNTKKVPEIVSKFFPCEPENKVSVVEQIEHEFAHLLKGRRPRTSDLFIEDKKDATGRWMGYRRKYDVFTYEELAESLWGIRIGAEEFRITVCYHEGQVGLIIRVATGNIKIINNLETYKSMYQI